MSPEIIWEMPATKPLDEAVWKAWIARGQARDRRDDAARMNVVKGASIVGLLAAATLWSHAKYEVSVRFIVTAGALVVTRQALRAGHYAFAAVFAVLAVVFNPIAPVFEFSGGWQRVLLVASAVPFLASLARREMKLAAS
jgi:hypothetical protein